MEMTKRTEKVVVARQTEPWYYVCVFTPTPTSPSSLQRRQSTRN
jgi:hypothetical protein